MAEHAPIAPLSRTKVARAIILSWLVPGLGEMYLGRRVQGLAVLVPLAVFWITANFVLDPPWPLLPAGLLLWVVSQLQVRRAVGIGWRPLLPLADAVGGRLGRLLFRL